MTAAYDMFADENDADIVDAERIRWPSPAWRGRHVEFARDVLGKRTIAKHQRKILDAYYSSDRVDIVCCTGQKLGKTEVEIIVAAFDFATEKGLEGLVIGPKIEHSGKVFWKRFCVDILAAYYPCAACMPAHRAWCALVEENPYDETARPERCDNCSPLIPSTWKNQRKKELGRVSEWLSVESCEKGLRAPDGRSIAAYTSRKEGGQGGFSGKVRIYADECSDVDDETRRSCKGNMSGGGKAIWFGNLLHPHGWFARAFKTDQSLFTAVFQISSRLSPNIPGPVTWRDGKQTPVNDNAERPIPGMADFIGIDSNLHEWRNAPNFIAARIDADHIKVVEGQLSPIAVVTAAEARWNDGLEGEGRLQLGVDVARIRHRFAIAPRRGKRIFEVSAEVLGDETYERAAILVRDKAREYRKPHERKPVVVFDKSGPEGKKFAAEIAKYEDELEIYGLEMGAPPRRKRLFYKLRDEIAHSFSAWLRGGAIPPDHELEEEIEVTTAKIVKFRWHDTDWDVSQVILNEEVAKLIDRSPDKRNACELAVWDVDGSEPTLAAPMNSDPDTRPDSPQAKRAVKETYVANDDFEQTFDAYGAADAMMGMLWGDA